VIVSTCPVCDAHSIGIVEKVAAGLTSEVRCKQCGGCVRLRWPTRFHRNWIQSVALLGGLILSFVFLTPAPMAVGLAAMVLAPVFLDVVANTRDPLTARRMRSMPDREG
jgi:hypothetical protein